ncbi:MAG: TRAP transporter substrate-binding protein DctP [Pseudomonadota bacterium]
MKHFAITGAVLASFTSPSTAHAETTQWTMAYLGLAGTIYEEVALAVPDRIAAATDGKLVITPNSSILKGNRYLEGVRDGAVQMSLVVAAYYTGSEPLFTVPSIPGISESFDDLKALSASEWGEEFRATFETEYNSILVMQSAFCPQTLFSTVPITTLEEWDGRKLRVNNRGMGLVGAELGATTVSLSASEVLPALERGVIEGVITDSCWALGAGFNSVVTNASNWRLGSVLPAPLVVNKDAWDALPDDVREAAAAEFAAIEAEFELKWREREAALPDMWREAGVTFDEITDAEMERAYDERLVGKVIEAWREDMDRVGLDTDATLSIAREAVAK